MIASAPYVRSVVMCTACDEMTELNVAGDSAGGAVAAHGAAGAKPHAAQPACAMATRASYVSPS